MDDLNFAMSQVRAEDESVNVDLYQKYYGNSSWNTSLNFTRQEAEYIVSCGTISVGTFANRAPFSSYHATESRFDGINVAILNRISELSGLQFELQGIDITTSATDALKSGQYDMVIGISRSPSFLEDTELKLSDPITANKSVLIGKSGERIELSTVQTAAIPTAYKSISLYAADHFPQIQLKFYDSNYDCMRALQRGDAQVMVESDAVAKYLLQNPRFSDLTVYSALYLDQYSCIGTLANSDPCLISIINKTLSILSARELGEIELSYTSARNTDFSVFDMLYPNRVAIVIAILLVALMLVLLNLIQRFHHKQRENMVQMQIVQAANEAKSNFLARMSHDMRTPLNGILGLTSLAIDEVNDPKSALSDLIKIRDSGDFLLGLVNDVLDMSQIEKGAMRLKQEPYSYTDFIGGVKAMFVPLCQQKGLNFICDPNPMQVTIITDKVRQNQIFFNILSNAVKYTPEGGTIIFRRENMEWTDQTLTCDYVIEDTGIGMSTEFQKHMYESFSRESQALTAGMEGNGLGLSIAQNLVKLMGGQLSIVSKQGKGTTVTIHLRSKLAPNTQSNPTEKYQPPIQQTMLEGKRVLLVEDHPLNAEIATRLLQKKQMIVIRAGNGRSAVEQFQASSPSYFDAILMDIRMPEMNGIDATIAIRALERVDAKTVPIIAMTANAFEEDVRRSHDAGMNAHLAKPIVPEELYQTLEEQIGRAATKN
ncbi:MAG: response regulator [Eubacteriales bacterium]|nr:response regulator [Eubacteriales bacterium]